jgi:outer membrane protein TolC
MLRFALLLAVFAVFIGAQDAAAQVLTLEAARSRALASQPALRALELTARAAEDAAPADGLPPDPRMKLGALNLPLRNFSWTRDDMTQLVLSLEQTIPGGDKRRLRSERTLAEAGQARAEALAQREVIRRDVALAWLDAWQATAAARFAQSLIAEYARGIDLAAIGLSTGRVSQSELHAARQMQAQATDRRLELGAQAERARAGLRRWVPDAASFDLPDELPAWREPRRVDVAAHPQQRALERAHALSEAEVALAREAATPDKTFEVGYAYRQGRPRSDMLMFQFAVDLPIWKEARQDRVLESKLKLAERVREQRADQLQQLRAELDAAHAEWRIAGERLANYERGVLPAARARLEALLAAQSAGRGELAQVFDGRRQLLEAQLQETALRAAQAKARVALEYFEGEDK